MSEETKKEDWKEELRKAIREELKSLTPSKPETPKEEPEHVFSSEDEMTDFVLKKLKEDKKVDREGKCILCGRKESEPEPEEGIRFGRD